MEFCSLVWDSKTLTIPPRMGQPNKDQLAGSDLDNLVELAGRVCYDSLGGKRSRPSDSYHAHIIQVGHGSVWEHANLTFQTSPISLEMRGRIALACANRPGLFLRAGNDAQTRPLRLTANLRTIREWFDWPTPCQVGTDLGSQLQTLAIDKAPLVCQQLSPPAVQHDFGLELVAPETDDEIWISLHIADVSRGFSHELVRHGDWTAISQRSTRFVNEAKSPWCWHPLQEKFLYGDGELTAQIEQVQEAARLAYDDVVGKIQRGLEQEGVDAFTARKQARGAARGLLGNALETQLIFSANLAQWKRMILMRASAAADAEIRRVFDEVYALLKKLYPNRMAGFATRSCPDKIGQEVYKAS
ncbi:MAG: FAD-dependent thymidylate synthase [Planctomycetota bacterium]